MLELIGRVHARCVAPRRAHVLAEILGRMLPPRGRVLDVGAGDGRIDALLMGARPGLAIEGVDIAVRRDGVIPVSAYDGRTLPFPDRSFDWILLVDTVHHARDPEGLLAEAARVARSGLVIKDHLRRNALDQAVLGLMDWVGNRPHGVPIPYRYMDEATWRRIFRDLGARVECWEGRPRLYAWPAGLLLNRSLHFVAKVVTGRAAPAAPPA